VIGVQPDTDAVGRANASARPPVVFIHGLWLLPSSWDQWIAMFEEAGYSAIAAAWPDDPPAVFAGRGVGQAADHLDAIVRKLRVKPAIIGHSFGGLMTQILAGRGRAAVSVAIDPAPFRGVLPVPLSALKAAGPVLRNPANRGRAIRLTYEQWRYAFTNAVSEAEAKDLYERYAVPAPGRPIFQAAFANLNPASEVKVDTRNPDRGPLLIISGEHDHTVPPAIARASYRLQRRNPGLTELAEMKGRGHSLTIDSGWREVAATALSFVQRFAKGQTA
jgi:non-heme chloroperoxidase